MKPSSDPRADELRNKNLSEPKPVSITESVKVNAEKQAGANDDRLDNDDSEEENQNE